MREAQLLDRDDRARTDLLRVVQFSDRDLLTVTTDLERSPVRITCSGELCGFSSHLLDGELRAVRCASFESVELDLSALDLLAAAGVDVIFAHQRGFERAGGSLRVVAASPIAEKVLTLCRAREAALLPTVLTPSGPG